MRRSRILLTAASIAAALVGAASTQEHRGGAGFPRDRLVDLALELDDSALASLRAQRDRDVPGRLAVDDGGERTSAVDVKVHIKGQRGSKRSIDSKPALKIDVADGRAVFGRENLTLNNMVQDPTMLHETLGYQAYADAGVVVPDTAFVRLEINGQPYGLYLLVESIDRGFLERRFDDGAGILYEGNYGTDLRRTDKAKFELDEGHDPGRAQLGRFIDAVETGGDELFYGSGALVDTPSFLSMMAVAAIIADWDNYYTANNYRIYWSPKRQRWSFIPTGIDQSFTKSETTPFGGTGVVIRKCLESARCRADYVAAVRRLVDRFERLDLSGRMEQLASRLADAVKADPKRPYSTDTIRSAREKMRRFIADRPAAIRLTLEREGSRDAVSHSGPRRAPSPSSRGRGR